MRSKLRHGGFASRQLFCYPLDSLCPRLKRGINTVDPCHGDFTAPAKRVLAVIYCAPKETFCTRANSLCRNLVDLFLFKKKLFACSAESEK